MYYSDKQIPLIDDYDGDIFTINSIDIINAWKEFELDMPEDIEPQEFVETIMDAFDRDNYLEMDNSYNWLSRVNHHFDYKMVAIDNCYLTLVKWHISGDVRGNYTGYALYKTHYPDSMLWKMEEACYQPRTITIDDKEFSLILSPTREAVEVGIKIDGYDYEEVEGIYDMNDLIKYVRGEN